jgi:DNA modification methylase
MVWDMQETDSYVKIDDIKDRILQGDCIKVLKSFPSESIDVVITSPPYWGQRDYNVEGQVGLETTPMEYVEKILQFTSEIKRVLKKTGQFWLNLGDSYGSNQGKYAGYHDRKTSEKLSYSERNFPQYQKSLLMIPERIAIRMIDEQGWILRNKVKWAKQVYVYKQRKTIGVVLPTSATDRFNESGEEFYFFVKNQKYYSNLDAVRIPYQYIGIIDFRPPGYLRQKLYANSKYNKFNYLPGEEKMKKYVSPQELEELKNQYKLHPSGKNIPTIWQINPEQHSFSKELNIDTDHFATFPLSLVEIPIVFGCPENGIVLDPFCGSGTTLIVAKQKHRHYIGIELNPEYIKIAESRLKKMPKSLFDYVPLSAQFLV